MIFLNEIYRQLYWNWAGKINHFPLIKLTLESLDKAIFYFLIFLVCRCCWRHYHPHKHSWPWELRLWCLVIYLLLLFFLTVFRQSYFPWQLHFYWNRDWRAINWHPFVETWKLTAGRSHLDFVYNLFGNILWFIPWGYLYPRLRSRSLPGYWVLLSGCGLSILIESLQFILFTGVSDIDDVIFNTLGTILGYGLYHWRWKR
ncbi:VanZ family protein [Lactobacillus sp. DCY120]|uniref:VanZ family protein n=1 Tax=Bombilactobacillus apium TaxID=2675299 RepID=A0A850R444_9LACO|nr:VanZ family protein [Bombilactobacillus apium]NVY95607.1 VanZ family protein [Bombilactobacillus apium]